MIADKLLSWGVYYEYAVGKVHCFKYQLPMIDVIIVSDSEKEKAADKFFIELLKGVHYSLKELKLLNRNEEYTNLVKKLQSLKDENIDKTIEIFERQFGVGT